MENKNNQYIIDAKNLNYKSLNNLIREKIKELNQYNIYNNSYNNSYNNNFKGQNSVYEEQNIENQKSDFPKSVITSITTDITEDTPAGTTKDMIVGTTKDTPVNITKDITADVTTNMTIIIKNVLGQRYIGDGIKNKINIKIYGTPGNDLGAFMDGPQIEVFGNCQDGTANTLNSGKIIVHGECGDILGYSMRGGEVYIKGNVGWRTGIHMKSYKENYPVIVIGGNAGNFLGEYMAGGIIVVLGLLKDFNLSNLNLKDYSNRFYYSSMNSITGGFVGTGMHGGVIYIRGDIEDNKIGKEVKKENVSLEDKKILERYLNNFCKYFNIKFSDITSKNFTNFIKLIPHSHRPYGKIYAY